ncbi:MAG: hypothetical protein IJL78_02160 [Lachnospiraceae bacterium]|nr:hypothetical protein [Lachnospiraceae bacterium]
MVEWWYSKKSADDVILVSRIRLLRNFSEYRFPDTMNDDDREEIRERILPLIPDMQDRLGMGIRHLPYERFSPEERLALQERQLINKAAQGAEKRIEVLASQDEAFSLTLNSTDHVRLLYSRYGNRLSELYQKIQPIDRMLGDTVPYAWSERFGYKTSTIANVGTGMRAYFVMHLPFLSGTKNFSQVTEEIGRYGVVVRNAITEAGKRSMGLYVIYNHRSMGLTENNIMDILTNVAGRLAGQEREMQGHADRVRMRDRVLRSYGILRYAQRMDFFESIVHLSNLLLGVSHGILTTSGDFSIYELMLGVQPGNLQVYHKSLFDEETIRIKRADYLRYFISTIDAD